MKTKTKLQLKITEKLKLKNKSKRKSHCDDDDGDDDFSVCLIHSTVFVVVVDDIHRVGHQAQSRLFTGR